MDVLHYLMLRVTSAVVITCDGSKSPSLIHLLRMAYMLLDRLSNCTWTELSYSRILRTLSCTSLRRSDARTFEIYCLNFMSAALSLSPFALNYGFPVASNSYP